MKISLCQINLKTGDLKYNIEKIKKLYKSESTNSDLVIFPELSLTGYLLKDLVNNSDFLDKIWKFRTEMLEFTQEKKCALLFGCPVLKNNKVFNERVESYNNKCHELKVKIEVKLINTKLYLSNKYSYMSF